MLEPRAHNDSIPETMFGMDVRKDSLPDNIGESAAKLWRDGDRRLSIALLYRGCLAQIIARGVILDASYTEMECVSATDSTTSDRVDQPMREYFHELTQIWRRFAYGHIEPEFETAEPYFKRWPSVWEQLEEHSSPAKGGHQ